MESTTRIADKTMGLQWKDCFFLTLSACIVLVFIFLALDLVGYWLLSLLALPFFSYSIIWGVEYLWWKYVKKVPDPKAKIGFNRQIKYITTTASLPCEERGKYVTLGWWNDKYRL